MISIQIKYTGDDIATPRDAALRELASSRDVIRAAKSRIATEVDRAGQSEWDRRGRWMELSTPLQRTIRGNHGIPRDASNAFFKAIELFNLLAPSIRVARPLRIFDNASLPGDFIRAIKWWVAHDPSRERFEVDWRANSLEGGLDDRFGLLRDNNERWMMGEYVDDRDHTTYMNGDVRSADNRAMIREHLLEWRADIYTSDLGFAVDDPFREEEEHFEAHRGQCLLGLDVLRVGGTFIVKTFTVSTPETLDLMQAVAARFEQFYIVKPETSKPDNSECYWVGLCMTDSKKTDAPGDEVPRVALLAARLLAARQAEKINQNIALFRSGRSPNFTREIAAWRRLHISNKPAPPGN